MSHPEIGVKGFKLFVGFLSRISDILLFSNVSVEGEVGANAVELILIVGENVKSVFLGAIISFKFDHLIQSSLELLKCVLSH